MFRPKKSRGRRAVVRSRGVARRTKEGFVVKPFTIDPRHWEALRREAFRRAAAAGYGKPDASKVLRELLDAWMKASRGKP